MFSYKTPMLTAKKRVRKEKGGRKEDKEAERGTLKIRRSHHQRTKEEVLMGGAAGEEKETRARK